MRNKKKLSKANKQKRFLRGKQEDGNGDRLFRPFSIGLFDKGQADELVAKIKEE